MEGWLNEEREEETKVGDKRSMEEETDGRKKLMEEERKGGMKWWKVKKKNLSFASFHSLLSLPSLSFSPHLSCFSLHILFIHVFIFTRSA